MGRIWVARDGSYVVLEQSSDVTGTHDRTRPGLNHLALTVPSKAILDELRDRASEYGWIELWADRYPYAGGPQHVALYIENGEGFEFEIVAAAPLTTAD